jgi:formamidopyrimidine-DNA glycosylase
MLELPECATLALQLNSTVIGRQVVKARAGTSPHGFAFFSGNPMEYETLLEGRTICEASGFGGILEINLDGLLLLLSDGANLRFFPPGARIPEKHQLLLRLDDGSDLICTVQMYAGIHLCEEGTFHSTYHREAHEKPSPLSGEFSEAYFFTLVQASPGLSAKAFLATAQRMPGLGNGTLQDILFRARIHPKARLSALSHESLVNLYRQIRETLLEMTALGGRDTEKDLYGQPGGYFTQMSRNTVGKPCPACGAALRREAYLGGNVYFCPACQILPKT